MKSLLQLAGIIREKWNSISAGIWYPWLLFSVLIILWALGYDLWSKSFVSYMVDLYPDFILRNILVKVNVVEMVITWLGILWFLYMIKVKDILGTYPLAKRWYLIIEKNASLFLVLYVVLSLGWFGWVLFNHPYNSEYGGGDPSLHAQILHNVINGFSFEQTALYKSSRYIQDNPYFFASIFSIFQYWLPLIVLPPLYALYPYPPMHVFSVIIVVILAGSFGVYIAVRAFDGSKIAALLAAIGYCLLPQIEHSIFYGAYFENLSYAVLPYVIAALVAKRWGWFYVSSLMLSMVNAPCAYLTMIIGVVGAVFFRAIRAGIIVFLIGFLVLQFDWLIMKQSLYGINVDPDHISSFFETYVVSKIKDGMTPLLNAIIFNIFYLFVLLMTLAYIPVYGMKIDGKWNWQVIGLSMISLFGVCMAIFRMYGWTYHRNSFIVAPLYFAAILSYINLRKAGGNSSGTIRSMIPLILIASMMTMTLWNTRYYPWVGLSPVAKEKGITLISMLKADPDKKKYDDYLNTIRKFVPDEASIVIYVDHMLQDSLQNRHQSWFLGVHPEGAEYYIIQSTDVTSTVAPWRQTLQELEKSENFKGLYGDGELYIFKNLYPQTIQIPKAILLKNILYKAFAFPIIDSKTISTAERYS